MGQVDTFLFGLMGGEYLEVTVLLEDVRVEVVLLDRFGCPLLEASRVPFDRGSKKIWFISEREAAYQLAIRCLGNMEGRYTLLTEIAYPAEPEERFKAEACMARREAQISTGNEFYARMEALRTLWERAGEPLRVALNHAAMGDRFRRARRFGDAIIAYQRGLQNLPGEEARIWRPYFLTGLALLHRESGNSKRAKSYFEETITRVGSCGDSYQLAIALNRFGLFYYSRGHIRGAILCFSRAIGLFRQLEEKELAIKALTNTALCYSFSGKSEATRDLFAVALDFWQRRQNARTEGLLLVEIAWTHYLDGDFDKARALLLEALAKKKACGDQVGMAGALDRLGTVLRSKGMFQEALSAHEKSLKIFEDGNHMRAAAHVWSNLGQTMLLLQEPDKAQMYAEKALNIFQMADDPDGELGACYTLARIFRSRGDLATAWTFADRAREIVSSYREENTLRTLSREFAARTHAFFVFAIDLLIDLDRADGRKGFAEWAFQLHEWNPGRTLRSELVSQSAPSDPNLSRWMMRVQTELNRKERERRSVSRKRPEKKQLLQKEIRHLLITLDKLRSEGAKTQAPPEPLPLATIQRQLLNENVALLVFSLGAKRGFLWEIHPFDAYLHTLPGQTELCRKVWGLFRALKEPMPSKSRRRHFLAGRLSEVLFGDMGPRIKNKKILIVPDGCLNLLPFAALPAPYEEGRNRPMVDFNEIVYLPSATYGVMLRAKLAERERPDKLAVVFADPVFSTEDSRFNRARAKNKSKSVPAKPEVFLKLNHDSKPDHGLRRLVYTRQEASAIRRHGSGGEVLVVQGFDASRQTLFQTQTEHYKILHFATHSFIHPEYPELSGVALSMVAADGSEIDGYFRAHEFPFLQLRADLVVLSACETALGKEIVGEGVWGLSQALLSAGAARVMVTLWPVHDQASAYLMDRFYFDHLRGGHPAGAALRLAQIDMRKTIWKLPAYWAGFVLQGEWQEFEDQIIPKNQ